MNDLEGAGMRGARGFTLLEVLVAVIVLGIGVVALVGSSALVTRMIGQGRRSTRGVQLAERRLELIRAQALATSPACAALTGGTVSHPGGVNERWATVARARAADVTVVVTYPGARGPHSDTLATTVACL